MSNATSPIWWVPTSPVGSGDNAWQLTAASLVGLQSVPGLVVLYAGVMKKKWAINSAFMAFYAFAAVLICWVLWAYEASFGEYMLPLVGKPNNVLGIDRLLTQSNLPSLNGGAGASQAMPLATMVYFQFVFAAITLVITAGAFLGRMSFYAWMVFVPLWLTLSYTVGAYSIWGGGFLTQLGVLDYSGGYVIHLSSGTAGFIGSYWIGPRMAKDREDARPNNILVVLIGAGILWIGWNGFNGGDPYAASADAGVAVLNTNLCTAVSLLVWTGLDMVVFKKPSVIGAVQGMITGLVAITPAAGYVAGWGAILLGLGSGSVPWFTMNIVAKKLSWLERHFDDTLGVMHTHMVAGFVGGFGTGLWATVDGCAAFGATNPGGAIAGNGIQLGYQMAGALFIIGWNLVWTSLILLFIQHVLRIPLRMSDEELFLGDDAVHGEAAYVFGPCEAHEELGHAGYIQGEMVQTAAASSPAAGGPGDNDGGAELGIGGSTVVPKDKTSSGTGEGSTPTQ
ncbi:ammonium transporter, Amt family [Sporothrix brasiliensis 5110]|uniref:Ammonium transporter n=1 Tax=Sporothrix brasiliensis 5110 TaxID=1398154 RepID=A0A0C2J0T9_9PEZI|nr:ammonium transporter, Amt family [Sporothrix brasiliensis 5110]KIH92605.1 ammonium transporter, Amt family [Sporothrix brasiliensis 5110]